MMKNGKVFRVIEPNCYDPEERLKDMAASNVDVQVLCTIPVMFRYVTTLLLSSSPEPQSSSSTRS